MPTTWRQVHAAVQEWARQDWLSGYYSADNIYDWADETADGCEYVIYYQHQDDLWCEGTITPVHEIETELSSEGILSGDIQQRIQACVYFAIRNALVDAANETMKHDCEGN